MATKITINLKNLENKVKKVANKNSTELKVGFLSAKMAQIARQNEYGGVYPVSAEYRDRASKKGVILGDTITIIPRPFMATTAKLHKQKWQKLLMGLLADEVPPLQAMGLLGEEIRADIQDTITNNDFERNPAHIAKIKGKNTPLIDTGEMYRSVEYEVK